MHNKKPTVSIIMNCLNGEKYLREAIDSVNAQTYTDWEIIFWDNASSDNSAKIAKSYDNKLRYFLGDETISLGAARNKALEQCRGEFIAFLDCDDIWLAKKLEKQVLLFNNSNVGIVYTLARKFNSNGFINPDNEKFKENFTRMDFGSLFENYDITMSSAIISRKALFSLSHKYDPILEFAEEFDLFIRICYLYDAIRLNEYQTYYRIHKNMSSVYNYKLSILEKEYIISKLKLIYPDIDKKYKKVLNQLEIHKAWSKFLSLILDSRNKEARKYLLPYIGANIKYFICFFLSFFGFEAVKTVWDYYNRKKGKPPIIS